MKRGFCFVEFENESSVQNAVDAMHDKDLFGERIIVEISGKI
jgi:RNA recognition motif-containing protein